MGYVVEQSVVYDFQRGIKVLFLNGDSVRIELIEIVDREHCDIEHMRYNKGHVHIIFVMKWKILNWQ